MPAYRGSRSAVRLGRRAGLRISFDGDSISYQATYGFVNRWIADNPNIPTINLAVVGACIAASENATNNLEGRVSKIAAFGPSLHVVAIGTNDLASITDTVFMSRFQDYVSELRLAIPGVKIAACGIGPCGPSAAGGHANVNTYRGSVNAWLRSQVGTLIDAYIPRGEHPVYDVASAPTNTAWWNADQIHPLQIVHRAYWQILHDALDPYVSQMQGNAANPTLSFPNIADAPVSTACTMRARVTGLPFGQTRTLQVSGGPQTTRGLSSFDSTDKVLMNGDVPQVQATSSASNSTAVSGTLTFNGTGASWSVTTQPASYPSTTTTLDSTHKASTVTLDASQLVATAGNTNAFQLAMATAQPATDCVYFEVQAGVAGDTSVGKLISVHDSSLIGHYNNIAGLDTNFKQSGCSFSFPAGAVYNNGKTISSGGSGLDYLSYSVAAGEWIGVALQKSTGQVWIRTNSNGWIPGDPAARDGGIVLPAPLASYYCSVAPKTNTQSETINYGATAFSYSVPLGFRPHS